MWREHTCILLHRCFSLAPLESGPAPAGNHECLHSNYQFHCPLILDDRGPTCQRWIGFAGRDETNKWSACAVIWLTDDAIGA